MILAQCAQISHKIRSTAMIIQNAKNGFFKEQFPQTTSEVIRIT